MDAPQDQDQPDSSKNPHAGKRLRINSTGDVEEEKHGKLEIVNNKDDTTCNDDPCTLPIPLQLAIDYLASGELGALAVVSRACRDAAIASYRKRLQTPYHTIMESTTNTNTNAATAKRIKKDIFVGLENFPGAYKTKNPWCQGGRGGGMGDGGGSIWNARCRRSDITPDGCCWVPRWGVESSLLRRYHLPEERTLRLQIPEELKNQTVAVHCSLRTAAAGGGGGRNSSLLVIASKKSNVLPDGDGGAGEDSDPPMDYYAGEEGTQNELWGILYDVSSDNHTSTSTGSDSNSKGLFCPVFAQKLMMEPVDYEYSADCDTVCFGQTSRSADGNVFATITRMTHPEMCDTPMEVSVFDVTNHGFVRRHTIIDDAFMGDNDYGTMHTCISSGGDILSILHEEQYDDGGVWSVYDISGGLQPCKPILTLTGFLFSGHETFFTPDNEFVMIADASRGLTNAAGGLKSIIEEEFPEFAKRMVVCVDTS